MSKIIWHLRSSSVEYIFVCYTNQSKAVLSPTTNSCADMQHIGYIFLIEFSFLMEGPISAVILRSQHLGKLLRATRVRIHILSLIKNSSY